MAPQGLSGVMRVHESHSTKTITHKIVESRSKSTRPPWSVPSTRCLSLNCAEMYLVDGDGGSNHRTGFGEYQRHKAACNNNNPVSNDA